MVEDLKGAINSDSPKLKKDDNMTSLDLNSIIAKFQGEQKVAVDYMTQNLRDSGISDEVIYDLMRKGYLACDEVGYLIYYPELTKDVATSYFNKRIRKPSGNDKYIKPSGMASRLFRPPNLPVETFLDRTVPIIITEGEKKAIKATQDGFPCLALSGVNCWKKSATLEFLQHKTKEEILEWLEKQENSRINDEEEVEDIIPDILNTDWRDREVILCYDSDIAYKEQVHKALYCLSAYLIGEHKAKVKIVILPNTEAKGLDDYLIKFGKDTFQKLLDEAEFITLKEIQDVLSGNEHTALKFPINVFDTELAKLFQDLSDRMDAPIEYIACSALVGASTLMDGTCQIDVLGDGSWIDYPILWNAIIGSASEKKSPCMKITTDIINKFDEDLYQKYKEGMAKYNDELTNYKIEFSKYKQDKAKNPDVQPPHKPKPPNNKMLSIQSTTVESLVTAMVENEGRGIGILVDELASFIKSLGQYKGGKGNDEEYFLQSWKRNKYRHKRKTTNEDFLVYPSHNILGSIQPKVLYKYMFKGGFETTNGMIERWLYTCTDYKEKGKTELHRKKYNITPLQNTFKAIYNMTGLTTYKFSPDAQKAYIDYKDGITRLKNMDCITELMKTYLQKQTDYVARFSMVLHCMKHTYKTEIDKDTVDNAIRLSNYYVECFKRVAKMVMSVSSNSLAMATVDSLKIKGKTQITPSKLYQSNTSLYKSVPMAKLVLEILSNCGYGRLSKTANRGFKFFFYI